MAPQQVGQAGGAGLHEVLWNTCLQQHVPAEALSRASAYGWLGALLFAPLGYALAGPVSNWIGVATTLWVGAAWVLVSTGLVRDGRRTGQAASVVSGVG